MDQLKDKLTVINQVATIAYHRLKSNAEVSKYIDCCHSFLHIDTASNHLFTISDEYHPIAN